MKNASLELKSIADDICDDVANDGIYSYCKAIGFDIRLHKESWFYKWKNG